MKPLPSRFFCLLALTLSACAAPPPAPTRTEAPPPTSPPSRTPSPTATSAPTETTIPPTATATATPEPQPLLLRRKCGRDYVVRAGEAIEIYYGGWAVTGLDLAQQWATALTIDLTIDELPVQGGQQPPAPDLPYNCAASDVEDLYWLYYTVVIPELALGRHDVTVTYKALRALPDGSGLIYGPGQLFQQTFRITAQ